MTGEGLASGAKVTTVSLEQQGIERPRKTSPRRRPPLPRANFQWGTPKDRRAWFLNWRAGQRCRSCGSSRHRELRAVHRPGEEKLFTPNLKKALKFELGQMRIEVAKCVVYCDVCLATRRNPAAATRTPAGQRA